MASSDASRASVGLRVPARKASTSEQASSSHGSVMGRTYLAARRPSGPGTGVSAPSRVRPSPGAS